MEVKLIEHTVPKKTQWGTVQKSLNQHYVLLLNEETGKFTQCGFVGPVAFQPLCGFPPEMVDEVTKLCEQQLGRQLVGSAPPVSMEQIAAAEQAQDEFEDDDE